MTQRDFDCMGETSFAPSERADDETLLLQASAASECAGPAMELLPVAVVVLNGCRQVVYANRAFLLLAGLDSPTAALGRRPGEILDCVHAMESKSGCGTTDFCRYCGAARSIMDSLGGTVRSMHCRILRSGGCHAEAMDLRTTAAPLDAYGERFSVFTIEDVSHKYRLNALERVFFHDLTSRVDAVEVMLNMLREGEIDARRGAEVIADSVDELREVVQVQADLTSAEAGTLLPDIETVGALGLLEALRDKWNAHPAARGREVVIGESFGASLETDRHLAARVLGVFMENALEAVEEGDAVTVTCQGDDEGVTFSVHNPGVLPQEVRYQVFKRTFSTKSRSRGFGTYAARLFAERYLGGKVDFFSDAERGTVFRMWLPLTTDSPAG